MADEMQALVVRMPPDIKAWLNEHAAENNRSMASEIVHMLKAARKACQAKEAAQ